MDWIAVASMIGAVVTALATIMLWRITTVLAKETKRLAKATAQPQVVLTIEPNSWSMHHSDLVISNTGNATAFDILINVQPPINVNHEGTSGPTGLPFQSISALRPSQGLRSWVGKMHEILEQRFEVEISWKSTPSGEREAYSYVLDMHDYENLRRLGSGDPLIQIADRLKKVQEDIHRVVQNGRIQADTFSEADRDEEERVAEERMMAWKAQSKDE